jgi:hypothetical protein
VLLSKASHGNIRVAWGKPFMDLLSKLGNLVAFHLTRSSARLQQLASGVLRELGMNLCRIDARLE